MKTTAKKATKIKVVVPPTPKEQMVRAESDFINDWNRTHIDIQPAPTRTYEIGERVSLGNLKNVIVLKKLFDGKAWVIQCDWQVHKDDAAVVQYRVVWWFDLEKIVDMSARPLLMSSYRQFPASAGDISSLLHFMQHGGLVCDPLYQRGYVWSEENKDALIESIFERLDIGSFLIVTHAGFNHKDDVTEVEYRTMDGNTVMVRRNDDYTCAIIDGQQRLTTILDFVLDKRPYKGVYFSQLHPRDRREFEGHSIQYRLIREEFVTKKDVVRMFLQSNRGVSQTAEHLEKVQALYNSLDDK